MYFTVRLKLVSLISKIPSVTPTSQRKAVSLILSFSMNVVPVTFYNPESTHLEHKGLIVLKLTLSPKA